MDSQNHSRPLGAFQTGIIGTNRFVERLLGIETHFIFYVAAPLGIDVVAIPRRIDLDVLRALIHQGLNLGLDDRHNVFEKVGVGRIDFVADAFLVVDRRELIGGGQSHFHVAGTVLLRKGKFMLR